MIIILALGWILLVILIGIGIEVLRYELKMKRKRNAEKEQAEFEAAQDRYQEHLNERIVFWFSKAKEAYDASEKAKQEEKKFCRCVHGSVMSTNHPCKDGCKKEK